jgi:hypothetical protein
VLTSIDSLASPVVRHAVATQRIRDVRDAVSSARKARMADAISGATEVLRAAIEAAKRRRLTGDDSRRRRTHTRHATPTLPAPT